MRSSTPYQSTFTITFAVFFWVFNGALLLVLYLGFLPFLGMAIISDAAKGEVPLGFLIPFVGLVGVPTASTVMGGMRQRDRAKLGSQAGMQPDEPSAVKRRQPISLFQIFYGIEAPLLMACTLRFFFLRDLTPASTFIFVSAALGTIATIHWLITARQAESQRTNWLHLAALTVMLMLSVYLSAIALFFLPPVLWAIAIGLIAIILWFVILFPLAVLSFGLVTMPLGMVAMFYHSWRQAWQQVATRFGKAWTSAFVGTVLAAWLGLLLTLQQQPQIQAFQLLETTPQQDSDRQSLLQKTDLIRKGLLNAYLAAYRYPLLDSKDMFYTYQSIGVDSITAQAIQDAYNWLITPFAYNGTGDDRAKAERLYGEFFDTPIIRGEREAVQKAVLSTFNRVEAKAGLLDVNSRRVMLEQQEVTVTPQGDWADVELHEIYANKTFDQTEIFYFFSLPESATLTGLWLGETADRAQRFQYVVAPRGAAQQVYNNEVQQRVDPALLEQVGPRNYRLRAFPIPPIGQDTLPKDGQPDRMHLWLTYKVMKQNKQWLLPVLHEQRNIYWTKNTKRIVNGKPQGGTETWLPESIATSATAANSHQVQLPGGYILANPLTDKDYQLPKNKRFAFILDDSYSMNAHKQELAQTLSWLKTNVLPSNQADLFLTKANATQAEAAGDLKTFDLNQAVFYGLLQPNQMLSQFNQAIATPKVKATANVTTNATTNVAANQLAIDATKYDATKYDAIVLLTDSGSYELNQDGKPVTMSAPLWLVHLGGLQPAYDDATLEAIQRTGGSVSTQIEEVMQRIATQPTLGTGTSLLNVVDGYAWFLSQTPNPQAADSDAIAPIAARQWIAQVSQAIKPDQVNQLDAIHKVAQQNSIVTPYSSMLVLVNDRQREDLKRAEENSDRFQREIEDQQLPQPAGIMPVSAVPEPTEWLLLIVGGVLVGVVAWRRSIAGQAEKVSQS